jgi:acyl-CoA dehydrogenase
MLDFNFSQEQEMVRKTVREYAQAELAPIVEDLDRLGHIPPNVIKELADIGLLGVTTQTEYGGIDADPVMAGIIAEELARGDITCSIPTFYLVSAAWADILERYGTDTAKRAILPHVCDGTAFLGIGATEPDVGSDLGNMRTVARREGDTFVLNGEKMFISGVKEVCETLPNGGGYVLLAKTTPEKGTRGISLFYVPLRDGDGMTPGVSHNVLDDWGRKGISAGGFAMEDVVIPAEYLIGELDRGFYLTMEGFDYARAIIGLVCCAVAQSCMEQAMDYIKMRSTFGTPIARYQGVQFKLAENWTKIEAMRLLAYRALWTYSRALSGGDVGRFEVTHACAEAKLMAPMMAFEAINDAIQWYGAFGYTKECPLTYALEGVRSYYWAEGAAEIMRIIVARELLGKEFVAYR